MLVRRATWYEWNWGMGKKKTGKWKKNAEQNTQFSTPCPQLIGENGWRQVSFWRFSYRSLCIFPTIKSISAQPHLRGVVMTFSAVKLWMRLLRCAAANCCVLILTQVKPWEGNKRATGGWEERTCSPLLCGKLLPMSPANHIKCQSL